MTEQKKSYEKDIKSELSHMQMNEEKREYGKRII